MNKTFRRLLGALALPAAVACHQQAAIPADNGIRAIAYLVDSLGREVGIVRFTETPGTPGVTIAIAVERGATPGQHGIHLHAAGKCDAAGAFATAGPHLNPTNKRHGLFNPEGPHAGDLEALTIDHRGRGTFVATSPRVTLSPGPTSLLGADGSAVVLHALPDDQRTDPSGSSGARIACGVVTRL